MTNDKKIGKTISQLRKTRHMTQEDLGKKLGISGKTISKWENNVTIPDYVMLEKLSEIFNVSIEGIINKNISNKKLRFKIQNKYKKIAIISFVLIIIISIIISLIIAFKDDSKTFNILSNSEEIEFKGYMFFSNEKNIITINNFRYTGNNGQNLVKRYDVYLKNDESIIYAYYSDELMNNDNYLSDIIKSISIDIIEIDEEDIEIISHTKLPNMKLIIEYYNDNYEVKSISTDLIIDNII